MAARRGGGMAGGGAVERGGGERAEGWGLWPTRRGVRFAELAGAFLGAIALKNATAAYHIMCGMWCGT